MKKRLVSLSEKYMPSIDTLPGDLSIVAESMEEYYQGEGVPRTIELAQILAGKPIYFRNVDFLFNRQRDDAIRADYDKGGITMMKPAKKFNLSLSRIKKILADTGEKRKTEQ